jgi:glycosyltransferase involved in cell wall biosynthesis
MPDFLVFSALLPKLLGRKVILYLFEDMPELMAAKYKLKDDHMMIRLLKWIEKLSVKFADHVIVCHEISRNKLVESRKVKTPISVVMNVPDERIFNSNLCKDYVSSDKTFCLVHHGTITENYGIQTTIQAIALLKKRMKIRLEIYGIGNYRASLEKLVQRLGLSKNVCFWGYVTQKELLKGLCKADLGVVALLNEYQSPNKLFELVALNRPVIASDLQTIKQHFNEACVQYFKRGNPEDLANNIFDLYNNPNMRASLVYNANRVYEKYKWTQMRSRYLNIYRELLEIE